MGLWEFQFVSHVVIFYHTVKQRLTSIEKCCLTLHWKEQPKAAKKSFKIDRKIQVLKKSFKLQNQLLVCDWGSQGGGESWCKLWQNRKWGDPPFVPTQLVTSGAKCQSNVSFLLSFLHIFTNTPFPFPNSIYFIALVICNKF